MTRECHVRFCERLGVRLPGATLPTGTANCRRNTCYMPTSRYQSKRLQRSPLHNLPHEGLNFDNCSKGSRALARIGRQKLFSEHPVCQPFFVRSRNQARLDERLAAK
jgi:hypothetical protein